MVFLLVALDNDVRLARVEWLLGGDDLSGHLKGVVLERGVQTSHGLNHHVYLLGGA